MSNEINKIYQPLGGEGWPAADVAEAAENRKSDSAPLASSCKNEPEHVENAQINRHAIGTAGSASVPIVITQRGIENWLHRYGSEARGDQFWAAYRLWLSCQMINQPAFHKSAAFRDAHHRDMRAFTKAIGLTQ